MDELFLVCFSLDNDDTLYRCLTFVQMAGSLVMAAGIPAVFQQHNFDMIIIGYVIMRLALVTQWIRVAKHDPLRKVTAYRYAIGIVLVQLGWLITNFSSIHLGPLLFLVLVICELAVPFYAENMRSHLGTHIILWSVMVC